MKDQNKISELNPYSFDLSAIYRKSNTIFHAIQSNNLVFFVGSGVSKAYNPDIPNWSELLNSLLSEVNISNEEKKEEIIYLIKKTQHLFFFSIFRVKEIQKMLEFVIHVIHRESLCRLCRFDHVMIAGDYLLELINELLDLARIESGKMVAVSQPVNLAAAINAATEITQPLMNAKQIHLINQCPTGESVLADPTRLRQILVNLLSNAAKYNLSGGYINISCHDQSYR